MKIALITDTHAGARNDAAAFNEYFLKFYREIFFPYLDSHPEIETIVHLGDVFDRRKYVNFQTLESWRTNVFEKLEAWRLQKEGRTIHIIIGNHDTFFKNTNTTNSVTELLGKYNWDVYKDPTTINLGGTDVCIVPWICEETHNPTLIELQKTQAQICMGHLELIGFDMFAGQTNLDHGYDPQLFNKFDRVFSGHFHHKSSKGNIDYLGSPYPMIWSDWGDRRGFHVFDTDTRDIEFIENPFQIFHKLFYNDTKETFESIMNQDFAALTGMYLKVIVQKKVNPYWFDQFIEALQKASPCDISIVEGSFEDSGETEDDVDEAKDTLTILMEYVDSLGLESGQEDLKQVLRDLYIEALNTNDQIQNS